MPPSVRVPERVLGAGMSVPPEVAEQKGSGWRRSPHARNAYKRVRALRQLVNLWATSVRPGKKQKYKGQDEPTRRAAEPRGQRPASPGEPTAQVCYKGARSASHPTARASGTETRSPHTCTASHPHLTFCTSGDYATTWDGRQSCGPGIWTTHQPCEQLTIEHGEARIKR